MPITINKFGAEQPETLVEFGDKHGFELIVNERGNDRSRGVERYYASFKDVEILDKGMLIGAVGNGNTPDEALYDYAKRLAGRKIVFKAWANVGQTIPSDRKEIDVPVDFRHVGM